MSLPPFTGSAPSPVPKITIADVPITLHNLREQIMENNAITKEAARIEVTRVINALNDEGRFDDDGAYQEALNQIQNFFPLSGSGRHRSRSRSRSRRSKKRSNRKRNATRR